MLSISVPIVMSDIVSTIMDGLTSSSLEMIDEIDTQPNEVSRNLSDSLQNMINSAEGIYFKRCANELNIKMDLLSAKTRKYKAMFEKYSSQFEKLQQCEIQSDQSKIIKKYDQQIQILEKKLREIMKKSKELGPDQLFNQIHETNKSIEELEKKNEELRDKLKPYAGFPADISEAEFVLSQLKDRIKEREIELEQLLHK